MPRKRLFPVLSIACFVFFVLGCSTAGKKFDSNYVDTIKKNVTTKDEIASALGEPLRREMHTSAGSETWHYVYTQSNVTCLGCLTHVFGAGREWKTKTQRLSIVFKNGIVVDYETYSTIRKQHQFL